MSLEETDFVVDTRNSKIFEKGDLGVRVKDGVFYIHLETLEKLRSAGLRESNYRSALALYSTLVDFPSNFVSGFGWNQEELNSAREGLLNVIKPIYPEVNFTSPKPRAYGARSNKP